MAAADGEGDAGGRKPSFFGRYFMGFCDRAVLLTYIGIVSAVVGMSMAFTGGLLWSLICLIVCGVCDMTDGTVARSCGWRTEEERAFGMQMDSLADALSFVALPVAISFGMGHTDPVSIAVCAFYVLTGLVRLGFFNVRASRSEISYYTGLPVTTVALVFPFLWLAHLYLDAGLTTAIYDVIMFLMAVLFISRIRMEKPGRAFYLGFAVAAAVGIVILLCL